MKRTHVIDNDSREVEVRVEYDKCTNVQLQDEASAALSQSQPDTEACANKQSEEEDTIAIPFPRFTKDVTRKVEDVDSRLSKFLFPKATWEVLYNSMI